MLSPWVQSLPCHSCMNSAARKCRSVTFRMDVPRIKAFWDRKLPVRCQTTAAKACPLGKGLACGNARSSRVINRANRAEASCFGYHSATDADKSCAMAKDFLGRAVDLINECRTHPDPIKAMEAPEKESSPDQRGFFLLIWSDLIREMGESVIEDTPKA